MKKKNLKFLLLLIVSILTLVFVAACGGDDDDTTGGNDNANGKDPVEEPADDPADEPEPEVKEDITIRWAHQWGEDHFWDGIGAELGERFPHIEIIVQDAGTDHTSTLEDVIAAGETPDIVTMGVASHTNFLYNLGLLYDHNEIIEETGFDIDRLEPSIVEYVSKRWPRLTTEEQEDGSRSEEGLSMIPNERPTWSLHYNKDVFDQFGVDYPVDGMTWEEVVELAKKVTGEMNGVQYRGLDIDVPSDEWTQFSQVLVDPETDEPYVLENEEFRRFLEMVKDVTDIPGNSPEDDPGGWLHNWGGHWGDGNIAMTTRKTHNGFLAAENVDIVTYPVWEGYEGLQPVPNGGGYAIVGTSEHKAELMDVIEWLLSDEYQMEVSRNGGTSILVNEDIHAVFAENVPELEGKNLEAPFLHDYATGPEETSRYGIPGLWMAPQDFVRSGQDINEFLREYHENGEEYIRGVKASE